MGEMSELLGAVSRIPGTTELATEGAQIKFVKYFSWEEMWMGRTMEARNEEMAWRQKGRINNWFFHWYLTHCSHRVGVSLPSAACGP